MMPKGIEQPADLHFHAQLLPAIAFGVKHLAHDRLAARQIIIRHDVHAAHQLQPSRGDKFAERLRFLGISFEEWPEVGYLIQSESIVGMVLEQTERRQYVRQPHLQVFLARFEDGSLPVRVGDDPESLLFRSTCHRWRRFGALRTPNAQTREQDKADRY